MQAIGVKGRMRTRNLVLTALFAALIAAGAFIKIPAPLVPVTMQAAFCMLAALLLGPKYATLSVAVYISIGLVGIPVFAAGGGLSYVFKPTFGYMIGFVFGTFSAGMIARGRFNEKAFSIRRFAIACLVCCGAVYAVGVPYMYLIMRLYLGVPVTVGYAVLTGWVVFIPTDLLWCGLASALAAKLLPILTKSGVEIVNLKDKQLIPKINK